MGGVKTIDEGTWKPRQKPCAYTKQKHKHMASKPITSHVLELDKHAANEQTHQPRVHSRQHAASENQAACNNTKHWRPHTPTTRQNMERECPVPDTKPKLSKTWVPGSEHHAPTWNRTRRREHTARAVSKPRTHIKTMTWRECQGSVTKPWMTLDRSDRTLTFIHILFIYLFIYLFVCLFVCLFSLVL